MDPFIIINAITNCTTAISCVALLVHILGDPNNPIWDNKIKAWLAKIGLSVTICGAISNALTLTSAPPSQVLLDCGISLTLCWLSWWQWEQFRERLAKTKPSTRRPRKRTKNKKRASSSVPNTQHINESN